MKKSTLLILPLIILYFGFIADISCQTIHDNYIYSWDVVDTVENSNDLNANTNDGVALKTVQYFDGLGRPLQSVQIGFTPNNKDFIKANEYTEFGLDTVNFQPYTDSIRSGQYRPNYSSDHETFYQGVFGDKYGMSPVVIEKSPLQRVVSQGLPGANWQSAHALRYRYCFNNQTDELKVRKWTVIDNKAWYNGYYPSNELYCLVTMDEDSTSSYEFKDKNGRIILKRVRVDCMTDYYDTYYIYDESNLLRYVLSPEGSFQIKSSFGIADDLVKQYAYYYRYDSRNRLVEKKIPGKEPEYYVYNKADQVVMYQDGNMRKNKMGVPKNEWLFTRYDAHGRIILTGITYRYLSETNDQLQHLANNIYGPTFEHLIKAAVYPAPYNIYYSSESFPVIEQNPKYLTVTYYDDYQIGTGTGRKNIIHEQGMNYNPNDASFLPAQADLINVKGRVTVTYTDFEGNLLPSVIYYDKLGRVIQQREFNHLKGYDIDSYLYSKLTDKVLQSEHKHSVDFGWDNYSQWERYEFLYDDEYRLLQRDYSSGTIPKHTINFEYDELGQLISKSHKDGTTFKQKTDYKYNIRGWLTKINDPDNFLNSADYFSMELVYNQKLDKYYNEPKFNGNISFMKWQTKPTMGTVPPDLSSLKAYELRYDKASRLQYAYYLEEIKGKLENTHKYDEHIARYDGNGNARLINRYGKDMAGRYGVVDNLSLAYNGNQLIAVDDGNLYDNGYDFCDNGHYYLHGTNDTIEYRYDANGNMISDVNKGIVNITYNELNLPLQIIMKDNNRIEYGYDAAGVKKRQIENHNGKIAKTTDFVGNFVYIRNKPAWHTFDEGRVIYEPDSTYFAETYIKDHLGNIRVAYGNDGVKDGIRQVNAYYPFGMNIQELSANSSSTVYRNEYLYNGKMSQDELGLDWLDYGARMYDAKIGRWQSIDPLAEISRSWNAYNYCMNNPIVNIDPIGMSSTSFLVDIWNRSGDGITIWKNDNNGSFNSNTGIKVNTQDPIGQSPHINSVNQNNKKNISKASWGETSGLYPIILNKDKNGKFIEPKNKQIYEPQNWDPALLMQLLKARAAIELLTTRNTKFHSTSPNLDDPIQKIMAAYHLTSNFPEVDPEILNDVDVKFFYLSSDAEAKTPSISKKYFSQEKVKTYGPFYSIGGGDAGKGPIFIHFYKAVNKNQIE